MITMTAVYEYLSSEYNLSNPKAEIRNTADGNIEIYVAHPETGEMFWRHMGSVTGLEDEIREQIKYLQSLLADEE